MPETFAPYVSALLHWNLATGFYVLAYLVGIAVFALMARRRGIATGGVAAVSVVGLLGGLVGANLAQWLSSGTPGKSVLGGVAGGYLAVALYKRYIGLQRPTGDLFAVALCAGEAVGRWGCYFGGCCYGKPAPHAGWGVWQHGAYRYPTQAYLSLACFAILGILVWLEARRRLPENGLFFVQGALYCIARFVVEFYRDAPTLAAAGHLTTAQWVCIGGFIFFVGRLSLLLRRTNLTKEQPSHVLA